ncbi:MAG TPA: universal stress protein [Streptosporangiaceae bacterium]
MNEPQVPGQPAQRDARQRVVVVVVDGSPGSGEALRQAASQARQRNALLDIVYVVPDGTAGPACVMARVKLGEFTRRECPYGTGTPVRLRVERGEPHTVLLLAAAEAELLINGLPRPPEPDDEPEAAPVVPPPPRLRRWARTLIQAPA